MSPTGYQYDLPFDSRDLNRNILWQGEEPELVLFVNEYGLNTLSISEETLDEYISAKLSSMGVAEDLFDVTKQLYLKRLDNLIIDAGDLEGNALGIAMEIDKLERPYVMPLAFDIEVSADENQVLTISMPAIAEANFGYSNGGLYSFKRIFDYPANWAQKGSITITVIPNDLTPEMVKSNFIFHEENGIYIFGKDEIPVESLIFSMYSGNLPLRPSTERFLWLGLYGGAIFAIVCTMVIIRGRRKHAGDN